MSYRPLISSHNDSEKQDNCHSDGSAERSTQLGTGVASRFVLRFSTDSLRHAPPLRPLTEAIHSLGFLSHYVR